MNPRELSSGDLSLLYHTATNLEGRQLRGIADRKLRHLLVPRLPIDFDARYESGIPDRVPVQTESIAANTEALRASLKGETRRRHRQSATRFADGTLEFNNQPFEFGTINEFAFDDPQFDTYSGMWRLKLQALTPVKWATLGYETAVECPPVVRQSIRTFITRWASEMEIGERQYLRRGWVPHAVSLRILALARYYTWLDDPDDDYVTLIRRMLYKNALFLCNHIEYDVGGNHLIENAAALVMAGAFFDDRSQTWLQRGVRLFEETANRQFLDDGGHFERSPMYHTLVLQRYLTAVDVLSGDETALPERVRTTATEAVHFLASLAPPDRRIPLLNDAAYDEFLAIPELLAYARTVGIAHPETDRYSSMVASGYYWLSDSDDRLLIDSGDVGPDHLPGHSHNDMLSTLLWIDGSQILTDTGAYNYVPDETRSRVRGVSAHNTVQVGRSDPIAIGGQYLMGRRCHPESRVRQSDGINHFTGWYEKERIMGTVYHHRRDVIAGNSWWIIVDTVDGAPTETVRARLHFHPDVALESMGGEYIFQRTDTQGAHGRLRPFGTHEVTETTSAYFPRFGEEIPRDTLRVQYDRAATHSGFALSTNPDSEIAVESTQAGELIVTIDDEHHEIDLTVSDNSPSLTE
jgi:uncharacterized heparinase superfamily protein